MHGWEWMSTCPDRWDSEAASGMKPSIVFDVTSRTVDWMTYSYKDAILLF